MSHTSHEAVRARIDRLRAERAARADKAVQRLKEAVTEQPPAEPPAA